MPLGVSGTFLGIFAVAEFSCFNVGPWGLLSHFALSSLGFVPLLLMCLPLTLSSNGYDLRVPGFPPSTFVPCIPDSDCDGAMTLFTEAATTLALLEFRTACVLELAWVSRL